jgi:DNA-directed RNA polymerase subunit RPC12/RpoP
MIRTIKEARTIKQLHAYKIDLTKIEGSGSFACPRCGTKISPDDETEAIYSILGSKVKGKSLDEVVIRCNKCSSHIHLTGFSLLQEMEMLEKELE